MDIHTGSCLCGAVRYETRGPLREVHACHCVQCRKQSGHYYASTNVSDDGLTIEGGSNITWYQSSQKARRGFCKLCGSALFWKHEDDDITSILAGSLDAPTGLTIGRHIYCASKGDYYEICDDKPQIP